MFFIILLVAAAISIPIVLNVLDKRRQKEVNGPKWVALAPLINGSSTTTGVQGQYQGRSVHAHQSYEMSQAPGQMIATQLWLYTLTMGTNAPAHGKKQNFEVALEGDALQSVSGDENAARQLLAACGLLNFQEMGLNGLRFDAGKNELTGLYLEKYKAAGFNDDIKLSNFAKPDQGTVPTPQQFQLQLDALVRLAEANERLDTTLA